VWNRVPGGSRRRGFSGKGKGMMKQPEPKHRFVVEKQPNGEALSIHFATESVGAQVCREAGVFGDLTVLTHYAVLTVNRCYDIDEVTEYLRDVLAE
jgi:hypothetical protein